MIPTPTYKSDNGTQFCRSDFIEPLLYNSLLSIRGIAETILIAPIYLVGGCITGVAGCAILPFSEARSDALLNYSIEGFSSAIEIPYAALLYFYEAIRCGASVLTAETYTAPSKGYKCFPDGTVIYTSPRSNPDHMVYTRSTSKAP